MVSVQCPTCGAVMQVPDQFVGKRGRCNQCSTIFTVPQTASGVGVARGVTDARESAASSNPFASAPGGAPPPATVDPFGIGASAGSSPFDAPGAGSNPFARAPAPAPPAATPRGVTPAARNPFAPSGGELVTPYAGPPGVAAAVPPPAPTGYAFFGGSTPPAPAAPPRPVPESPAASSPFNATGGEVVHPYAAPPYVAATAPPAAASPFGGTQTAAPPAAQPAPFAATEIANPFAGVAAGPAPSSTFSPFNEAENPFDASPPGGYAPSAPTAFTSAQEAAAVFSDDSSSSEQDDLGFEVNFQEQLADNASGEHAALEGVDSPLTDSSEYPPSSPVAATVLPEVSAQQAEPAARGPKAGEKEADSGPQKVVTAKYVPSKVPPKRSAANFANHKIDTVEAYVVNLAGKATLHLAGGTPVKEGKPTPRVLVKVVGSNGVIGWGEVTPCPSWSYETSESIVTTIRNYLAPAVLGLPAWNLDLVTRTMEKVIRPGATIGQPLAKSGIDTALYDLLARTLEVPLHVLFGGKRTNAIWLSYLVSANTPDEAVAQARKGMALGYSAFKIKVGMRNERTDRHLVRAVAEAVPKQTFLWVDANQGYNLETAIRQSQMFGGLGVRVFEQPIQGSRISAYRQLVRLQEVPIAVDETLGTPMDLVEYIRAEAVDLPIAKVQRCGGHFNSVKFCTVAEAAGLRLMGSGLCETDLGLAHSIHLFAAFGIDLPCDLNGRQFVESPFTSETLSIKKGHVVIPDRPGCGVDIDEAKVRKLAVDN